MKDTNYYNKESKYYSQKRYPEIEIDYVHFFFKKRLSIIINLLNFATKSKNNLKLLEVGCADGIILLEIERINVKFNEMIGIDISPEMIEVAKKNISSPKIKFHLRKEEEIFDNLYDIIIEVGVMNYTDMNAEFTFIKKHLKKDGYFICSLASNTSLLNKLKQRQEETYSHFLTYKQYENELERRFDILEIVVCGFFVPYIWKSPLLARRFQPIFERLCEKITPDLFHEKVYFLRKK